MQDLENMLINEVAIPEIGVLNLEQLLAKIETLSTTEKGQPLKNAMHDLKKALLANPAACTLMLPKDVGEMVKYLRMTVDKEILEANTPKKKGAGSDKATTVSLKNITREDLDNLSVDDL